MPRPSRRLFGPGLHVRERGRHRSAQPLRLRPRDDRRDGDHDGGARVLDFRGSLPRPARVGGRPRPTHDHDLRRSRPGSVHRPTDGKTRRSRERRCRPIHVDLVRAGRGVRRRGPSHRRGHGRLRASREGLAAAGRRRQEQHHDQVHEARQRPRGRLELRAPRRQGRARRGWARTLHRLRRRGEDEHRVHLRRQATRSDGPDLPRATAALDLSADRVLARLREHDPQFVPAAARGHRLHL